MLPMSKTIKDKQPLNTSYAPLMENEMSILKLPEKKPAPHQVQKHRHKKALVRFFSYTVFKNSTGYPAYNADGCNAVEV